jgi:hypothetical protein
MAPSNFLRNLPTTIKRLTIKTIYLMHITNKDSFGGREETLGSLRICREVTSNKITKMMTSSTTMKEEMKMIVLVEVQGCSRERSMWVPSWRVSSEDSSLAWSQLRLLLRHVRPNKVPKRAVGCWRRLSRRAIN